MIPNAPFFATYGGYAQKIRGWLLSFLKVTSNSLYAAGSFRDNRQAGANRKSVNSDLTIDEGAGIVHVFEVWEKSVPAGMFPLGANTGESMYGIAAIAEK